MVAPGTVLDSDAETKKFRYSASSYPDGRSPGSFNDTTAFYQAELDNVQRKLSGVHVQMYVRFPSAVHTFHPSRLGSQYALACLHFERPDF